MSRAHRLLLGVAIAAAAGIAAAAAGLGADAISTAAITGLCAAWWVLEPIPIPATSLIPFAAFPLCGVLDDETVATAYGHHMILLLLGGFMLSAAVEKSGVHRRLALGMVRMSGRGGRSLVAGFMLASALSSMWISNTATTLVLLPVALAVIDADESGELAVPLLLGIAYAASIGGMATPIGTPPNLIFMSVYEQATGRTISFLEWMGIGVPVAAAMLPLAWLVVTRRLRQVAAPAVPRAGAWTSSEVRVLMVFAATAAAWVFRTAPAGGWAGLADMPGVGDSTVALAAVVILFLLPDATGEPLLDWSTARRIPWGLLLLFGGGLAISAAFKASGLSASLGQAFLVIADWPAIALIFAVCLVVTFLTEVTSNTATSSLLMPVLVAAATAAALAPDQLMIPATLSASCAFMLPVATAPNAIVAGTEHISTRTMASTGIWINLLGAVVISLLCSVLLG
ncbi:MAG TPA: SLC13 family permease [Kofleriaceae bacterium]|nr:SLC13 family permease [Kofleriaceae bacterium]